MTQPNTPERLVKSAFLPTLLHNIAMAAGAFAAILCVLIIVNFVQLKRADPLNTKAMKIMVDRMHSNPEDQQIRQEIRELDLLSRKAFFTSQWQVRIGGYLLFICILIALLCIKTAELLQKKMPEVPGAKKPGLWQTRMVDRKWVAYTGITVIAVSVALIFLTHRDLGNNLGEALVAENPESAGRGTTGAGNAGNRESANPAIKGQGSSDSTQAVDTATKAVAASLDGYPSAGEIAGNFASFRGPGGNGVAFQTGIPTSWDGKSGKKLKWKTEIPLPGYNSPIVWNDRIFLTGATETKRVVYCLDLETGKILWQKAPEISQGSPAQVPKIIRETGYSAPTMTTDGRRVYAIFANGDLAAFDFEGNQLWAKNMGVPQNHYGHSSSLIMYRDLLIVQYDQRNAATVTAIAGKTGKTVWQTSRNVKISWASPVIVNTGKRTELILAADPIVASYNPADGKEYWQMECISGEVGPSVAYAGGVVFSVNDYSKLAAIGLGDTPKLLWEDTEYLSDIPSPVATENFLFLVTSYGAMVCYDAKNGTKYWEHEFGTPVFASPVLAEGKIFLLDKKGVMHIFKAGKEFTLISEPALGEGSSCTPAFAQGKIIIRGDKNIFCFGK